MIRKPRMLRRPQGPQGRPNKKPGNYYPYHHWDHCDDWWYYDDWYDWDWWYYDDWYDWDWDYYGTDTPRPRTSGQGNQLNQPTLQQAYKKGFSDGVRYANEKNNPIPEPSPDPSPEPGPNLQPKV